MMQRRYTHQYWQKYFKDIIFNISYEKTFWVTLKVELSQLKPGKTLKKSKILLKFVDLNKVFAFFWWR